MALYHETRNLDITKTPGRTGQVKAITLRRGEDNATEIWANILQNGTYFAHRTGYKYKFKAILPNGDMAEIPAVVTSYLGETIVSATVTNQLTAVTGKITVAYFEITTDDGAILTTDAIPIWVEQDADLSEGQYGQYQSHIDSLVKQLDDYIADARKAAEQANSAKDAADRANNAAQGVEEATKAANDAAMAANTATSTANSAAKNANDKAAELQQKADNGDFDGATFTPSVSASGDLSWTNNKGLANPSSQNIKGAKGDKGDPGSVTNLASHERVQMFYDYYVLKQQSVTPIIYVYSLDDGTELKFSPKPLTITDRVVTNSWQINSTDKPFASSNEVPWFEKDVRKLKKVSVEEIIIPQHMARWFYGFRALDDIEDLRYIDTSYATDFSALFIYCNSLKSVKPLSNWNTSKVKIMTNSFYDCYSVDDFTPIDGWSVSQVTERNNMFTNTTGTRPTWGVDW